MFVMVVSSSWMFSTLGYLNSLSSRFHASLEALCSSLGLRIALSATGSAHLRPPRCIYSIGLRYTFENGRKIVWSQLEVVTDFDYNNPYHSRGWPYVIPAPGVFSGRMRASIHHKGGGIALYLPAGTKPLYPGAGNGIRLPPVQTYCPGKQSDR